jgi:hypothetical protein
MTQSHIPKSILIGLGYRTGVGKSTIAHHLVSNHGFVRFSVAQALKQTASLLLGFPCDTPEFKDSWLIKCSGREFLQKLAEFIRDEVGDDYFITSLKLPEMLETHPRIVIDDVRFSSEVNYLQRMNGYCFEVIRPNLLQFKGDRELSSMWTGREARWNAQISNVDIGFAVEQILSVVCGEVLEPLSTDVGAARITVSALRPVAVPVNGEHPSFAVS